MTAVLQRLGFIALDQLRGWGHAALFVLDLIRPCRRRCGALAWWWRRFMPLATARW